MKKYVKHFTFIFICFVSVFIFNISNVKADTETKNGYAKCVYHYVAQSQDGSSVSSVLYQAVVRVYDDINGKHQGYVIMKRSDPYLEINTGGAKLTRVIDTYNVNVDSLYKSFHKDGKFKCKKSVYIKWQDNGYAFSATKKDAYSAMTYLSNGSDVKNEAASFSAGDDDDNYTGVKSIGDSLTDNSSTYEKVTGVDTAAIERWAEKAGESDVSSLGDACDIISADIAKLIKEAFLLISVVSIILIVVMTAASIIKAITGSDDEKFKDVYKNLMTRIIVIIILLLLPAFVTFVIDIVNDSVDSTVQIGDSSDIFCGITKN